jgi:hypothetical protein
MMALLCVLNYVVQLLHPLEQKHVNNLQENKIISCEWNDKLQQQAMLNTNPYFSFLKEVLQ